jgi:hypothetical protein
MATAKKKTTKPAKNTNVIASICEELKLDAKVARLRLRAAGMTAPYTDVGACRKALVAADKE